MVSRFFCLLQKNHETPHPQTNQKTPTKLKTIKRNPTTTYDIWAYVIKS